MGFGNGYSVKHDRGSRRYNNSQVAHIWAQGDPNKSGQSGNGNFFFSGRDLWSYGSHFLVGRIMSDNVVLLNADSYSVSTSRHQSDAASATRHLDHFYIKGLTDFRDALAHFDNRGRADSEERKRWKARIRKLLLERARDLTGRRNAYRWHNPESEGEGDQAGEYLARLAGFPASTWPAIVKERARLDAAKAKADAIAQAKENRRAAIRYADMSDSDWRAHMRKDTSRYESFYDREAKALYHAVRTAKAEGFSAKRRAILKERRADALRRKAGYHSLEQGFRRWQPIRQAIAYVRSAQRNLAAIPPLPIPTRESAVTALVSRFAQLSACEAFPVATRNRLAEQSNALRAVADDMDEELSAYREAEREREQAERAERERLATLKREEQIAAWHEGADVRISFDAESGGAAIRIKGDQLETSHGAAVPLEHAIKAFRFVKLVRQRGTEWQRNGKTIRVGHFQIDRIAANGDFVAGCHKFTWPEIERAAAMAGVADATADDSAVIPSA